MKNYSFFQVKHLINSTSVIFQFLSDLFSKLPKSKDTNYKILFVKGHNKTPDDVSKYFNDVILYFLFILLGKKINLFILLLSFTIRVQNLVCVSVKLNAKFCILFANDDVLFCFATK